MLSNKQKEFICGLYEECLNEQDRMETIEEFSEFYETPLYEIRQVLQDGKVFVKKEGKTEKEQFARALYAVTLISEKEWMKMTLKSMRKLMQVFKGSNQNAKI